MKTTRPARLRRVAIGIACSILLAGTAAAGPIPTLTLDSGSIVANPNDMVGWSLQLTADSTYWITVTSSSVEFESNPLGSYADYIGPIGGNAGGSTAPDGTWHLVFDPAGGLGYLIASSAIPGSVNTAVLRLNYELYSGDPASGGSYFDSGDLSAAVQISIADSSAVPEPAVWGPAAMALLMLVCARRRFGSA